VAAGESLATTYPFVASMRSPDGFGDGRPMVSVDNVDQPTGKLALILGLERLLDLGEGGHYGLGGNVDGVIPPLDVAA
jgi:copper transport outer membrane protein MctB